MSSIDRLVEQREEDAISPVAPVRAIGFRPSEISALVNRPVLDTHATEAAFLWLQRSRAVTAPHFRLHHLARLDRRIDGHLEGLRVDGRAGLRAALQRLDECDSGRVFVVGHLAFQAGDSEIMQRALQLGLAQPDFRAGLISALAWTTLPESASALSRLASSPMAAHRRVALAVRAARVEPLDLSLADAAESDDADLRARALRAIGDLKQHELHALARRAAQDPDDACRFWAARSCALLGDRQAAALAWAAAHTLPALRGTAKERVNGEIPDFIPSMQLRQ